MWSGEMRAQEGRNDFFCPLGNLFYVWLEREKRKKKGRGDVSFIFVENQSDLRVLPLRKHETIYTKIATVHCAEAA